MNGPKRKCKYLNGRISRSMLCFKEFLTFLFRMGWRRSLFKLQGYIVPAVRHHVVRRNDQLKEGRIPRTGKREQGSDYSAILSFLIPTGFSRYARPRRSLAGNPEVDRSLPRLSSVPRIGILRVGGRPVLRFICVKLPTFLELLHAPALPHSPFTLT